MRRTVATRLGPLRLAGREELFAPAAEQALAVARDDARAGRFVRLGEAEAWFKAGPLAGRARLRHGLGALLLHRPAPRLAELANLEWLRAHGFGAPEPLVAGVLGGLAAPRHQFLFTRRVERAEPLALFLARPAEPRRAQVLLVLARELARLHALGFVHRDLYPRNVLVAEGPGASIAFLDAWRGGRRRQLRGPAWDLGCLMLAGAGLLTGAEQERFFRAYLAERAARGRPAHPARLLAAAGRARSEQVRRHRRRPRADETAVLFSWEPPAL